jgi:hypothetical protein
MPGEYKKMRNKIVIYSVEISKKFPKITEKITNQKPSVRTTGPDYLQNTCQAGTLVLN